MNIAIRRQLAAASPHPAARAAKRLFSGLCATALGASGLSAPAIAAEGREPPAAAPCPADSHDQSICGVAHPEDMVPLPGTGWVLASGYSTDALYRINTRTRRAANLLGAVPARWNRRAYPGCPGPLAAGGLTGHGIAVSPGTSPRLFVINHGKREAIEVFAVRPRDAALTWIGCIPVPTDMMANSLVALPSGALAVTSLGTPGTDVLADLIASKPTGNVRTWSARDGWGLVAGSAGSGPNGLALAPDGRSLYVALSGDRRIVRLFFDKRIAPVQSDRMGILPDNLRWTPEGRLITTGMRFDPAANARCFKEPGCKPPFGVYEADPSTLALTSLAGRLEARSIPLTTTALRIGHSLWISSLGADRIFVFPLEP